MENLQQENEALKAQVARMSTQLFEVGSANKDHTSLISLV